MTDVSAKRVTVMGLGRFGGGVGVTRWLADRGADVLVTDLEPADSLKASINALSDLVDSGRVTLRLGEHNVCDFTTADLIIANPAVPRPWENRFLRAAAAASIPVTTEIELAIDRLPNRGNVIAVTGSVGKSTTSAMIAHGLNATGRRAHLAGNIGGSLLQDLGQVAHADWVVLELSSFMLYWLEDAFARHRRAPHIAVLTNLSPNHLDWHASLAHYESCKRYIYKFQNPDATAIFGPSLAHLAAECEQRAVVAAPRDFRLSPRIPGAHNVENAAVALTACRAACPDESPDQLAAAIADFGGLPHRLQLVREMSRPHSSAPIRFFNDSKSTTAESAVRAVEAIADMPGMSIGRIHLIAGGYDKGADLSPVSHLAPRLGALYTVGVTGPSLAAACDATAIVHECGTIAEAVRRAWTRLRPGDALLLSPACASWDQYSNYQQRGDEFVRLVTSL
ncbi:MAG: UDP-N-acetylmuramoyl-L-alanine--D-glutamate ligase [Phycisphaerales bacterium]